MDRYSLKRRYYGGRFGPFVAISGYFHVFLVEGPPADQETSAETNAVDIALQTAVETASELGQKAIEYHERAVSAVRLHRNSVVEALERFEKSTVSKGQWEILSNLSETKTKALEDAQQAAAQLSDVVEKVQISITEAKEKGLEASAAAASETLAKLTYALQQVKNRLNETQAEGTVLKQFQDFIEEGKQHLREELASIKPEFKDSKVRFAFCCVLYTDSPSNFCRL